MSDTTRTLPDFLQSQVAPRFREMVNAAEQRLAQAQREVDDLRNARGTIAWEVGDGPAAYVNIAGGEMRLEENAAQEPFMTVRMSADDWSSFSSGAAQGGLFAGDPRRPFGRSRIERVRAIKGAIRFVLTGLPDGSSFTATLYFAGERPPEPQATIQIPAEVAVKIQSGQLNPQAAFMQGQIKLAGDMGFAMQLGMALFL
jgi:putative sterol carrier protein